MSVFRYETIRREGDDIFENNKHKPKKLNVSAYRNTATLI